MEEGADFALGQCALARRGELWRGGFGNDGATDAVTADADRGDAGEDLDLGDVGRVKIGHRRIHVVGAGGDEIHAIHRDAQAVIGQAVDHRQAGDAAGTIEADAGYVAQQCGGVSGDGVLGGDLGRTDLLRRSGVTDLAGIDHDLVQGRLSRGLLAGQ